MEYVFAPGCALLIYKPQLAQRLYHVLKAKLPGLEVHDICCHHQSQLPESCQVVTVCSGCHKRHADAGFKTISAWELMMSDLWADFPWPDYAQRSMAILDPCPTRHEPQVHNAVRHLIERMNIQLVEPQRTATQGTCCGDSFYGVLPVDQVKQQMVKRAAEMPADDVIVYCVSCIKAMHIGGKQPRYLVDLLFGEKTHPATFEPEQWHAELDAFIEKH